MTRSDGSEKSTSIPKPSRLKSSITLNSRMLRPSINCSCMKSIDQTWLIAVGTDKGSGRSRMLAAQFGDGGAGFSLFEDGDNLAVGVTGDLHAELSKSYLENSTHKSAYLQGGLPNDSF